MDVVGQEDRKLKRAKVCPISGPGRLSASERKELGYVNAHTGDHKAGTHAFRRFRNTYLKNETSCPKGLRDYWLGHAGNSMDDLYDMVKDNAAFRNQKAAEYGVGFELPASIVPNVPKMRVERKRAKAA